ncbi:tripartite tricarboxylate transporter substrate binding protein [Variovorax sp. J2P1-59]|uniref:Bug family tripartite tricarboxylate transporter substrate binding protein n=1 Tax=Variovorax flavidus TaxID=3053501 RepID=UPI002574E7EB|nr:tripartite tricarboxylate transporter substrate binding protein [Variovorax sp. J2P1-59]MDM0077215.1 tripartite tricarboxylate transporter substrate binding protein [Variovorax sp. J2P1-59]
MLTTRRFIQTLAATLCTSGAWAQDASRSRAPRPSAAPGTWPTKPVRLLVGFPAGASPDLAARAIAAPLSKLLGQPVVVENRPGASGNFAADQVAKAQDDHTIGALINGNLTIAKLLNPHTPFDPEKDFAPVSLIGTAPLVLAVSSDAVGANPTELLLWARNLNDSGKYGTPGIGTVGHLGMELLKSRTNITAKHVPFTGNPQVINAMLAGQIQLALLPPGLAKPHVKSGKLKAVGVTSPMRSPLFDELPTLREANVRGADLEIWTALAAPSSLPAAAVAKLNAALVEVVRSAEVQQTLLAAGWQAQAGTPQALGYRMRNDTSQLGGVIIMRGIRSEA